MQNLSITIQDAEITQSGELLIKKMTIIDRSTGEDVRVAKMTPELLSFLTKVEIELHDYFKIEENPALKKLCNTFKLYNK